MKSKFQIAGLIVSILTVTTVAASQSVTVSDEMHNKLVELHKKYIDLKLKLNPSQLELLELKSTESELTSLCEFAPTDNTCLKLK